MAAWPHSLVEITAKCQLIVCVRETYVSIEIHQFRVNKTAFQRLERAELVKRILEFLRHQFSFGRRDLPCLGDGTPTQRPFVLKASFGIKDTAGNVKSNDGRP